MGAQGPLFIYFGGPGARIYLFWKKLVWIKYAGSRDDKHSPITYKLQRWYLKQFPKNTKISINGHYTGLKKNFYNLSTPVSMKKIMN